MSKQLCQNEKEHQLNDVRMSQLHPGTVVNTYRMRLAEQPVNPLRLWHGIVERVRHPICWVRLIDAGYEGLEELVLFYQITEIPEELTE